MRRYVFTVLLLATMMGSGSVSVYAQASHKNKETQKAVSNMQVEHLLTHGKIQSIAQEGDTLKSITMKATEGNTFVYAVNENTVFMDSGAKTKLGASTLQKGDEVYLYYMSGVTPLTAEAVVSNIPADTSCAKLHTVEELVINQDGTIVITSDAGSIKLEADTDIVIKEYDTNDILQISDIQVGSRFFTWYDTVLESYPARAGMKEMVILPAGKDVENSSVEAGYQNKVSYEKEKLPTMDGVSFVPLRETAAKLGLSISWDAKKRATKMESDTRSMNFTEGKDSYVSSTKIKGAVGMTAPLKLDAAPFIDKTNTMFVPAEAFRAFVGYDVTIAEDTVTIVKINHSK